MALLAISTFTFGQPQNALHLDGNDDYINCGNDASLNITGPVTIEAWVYFDAVISQYVRIVEKDWATSYYLGSTYGYDGISFCMDANGDVNNVLESPTELIYQQIWTHVAGTWDGSTLRIYINGDEVASMPWANPSITGSSNDVLIGKYYGNSTQNLTGYIDDVRIWNVARTASELRADMYKELDNPASEPNLVAYYSFNEGGGQTSADLSSNSNTAVLGGTLSIEPTDPSWITSNVPMPYHTVQNGIWHNVATWVDEQGWPFKAWAIVEIDHEVTAASDAVAGTLTINPTGALTVNSGSTLDISDSFTIKSGPAGTGSFIDNGTLNSPSPTVERYFAEDEWHLISSPVTNAQAGIFLGMYLQKYNETTGFWTDIINVTDPLNVMQGYALWIPTATTLTSEFSGTLNTGNLNFGFTANNPYGWNLLGNPYPSAIDWDLVVPVSNMNSAVYYLDAASGNYVSYVGGVGASRYIPPMQGFWISATSSGSLAFNNTMRTNTGKDIYYKSETDNLAVIRSCSKALGLAAERVGYMFLSERLSELYSSLDVPFEPSLYGAILACTVLKDKDYLDFVRQDSRKTKRIIMAALEAKGFSILPTHADVSIFTAWKEGADIVSLMRGINVLVEGGSVYHQTHSGWDESFSRIRVVAADRVDELCERIRSMNI